MSAPAKNVALWKPFPGPQTTFCAAQEFEVLFGGAKGPGKSDAILFAALAQVHKKAYKALILRESFPELTELMDRAHQVLPRLGPPAPKWNANDRRWRFPSGAVIEFGYCSTLADVARYQGQEWSYIGFDEVGNLATEDVWIALMKEVRCKDPSVRRYMRGSANPGGPGHPWLKRRFVDLCGKSGETVYNQTLTVPGLGSVSLSRRYIPARVTDNPIYANDPQYMAQLLSLPEVLRKQLLYGDWDAGMGTALDELNPAVHIVPAFPVPPHWVQFGAFDWGFAHPWVFGHFAVDESGTVYLVDTVKGRRHLPDEICERICDSVPVGSLDLTWAGHDCWSDNRSKADNIPTVAERMLDHGILVQQASIARRAGLNNLRHYIGYRGRGPEGKDIRPHFLLMDTPNNRWTFDQLQRMITDPDDPEDVLKQNADPMTGVGGDDAYDMVRYGLASRPMSAVAPPPADVHAFDPEILYFEAMTQMLHQSKPLKPRDARFDTEGDGLAGGF